MTIPKCEGLPIATGQSLKDGWILSPDFLLEVKSRVSEDYPVDLEEIENVLLAASRLATEYSLGWQK